MHRPSTRPDSVTNSSEVTAYLKRVTDSLGIDSPQRARALEEIENHLIDATAEHMRQGLPRPEAEALAIEELGSPETVGAELAIEADLIEPRTGIVRWLPMALPVAWLTGNAGTALGMLISLRDGWTVGDRVAMRTSLFLAVMAAVLTLGSFLSIQRADQNANWQWAAWTGSGAVIAYFVLR